MLVSALFFRNLPLGITSDRLIEALRTSFPGYFSEAIGRNAVDLRVFEPGRNEKGTFQYATIFLLRGYQVNFDELIIQAENQLCEDRNWRILVVLDFYEERDITGRPLEALLAEDKRERTALLGQVHPKPLECLKKQFKAGMGRRILDGGRAMFARNYVPGSINWQEAGRIRHEEEMEVYVDSRKTVIYKLTFASTLEALQSICFFNGRNVQFCNADGTEICLMTKACGLGISGTILELQEVAGNGYIPLSSLSDSIFDINFLKRVSGSCWKCKKSWQIIGLDIDLNFFAAKCSRCQYTLDLDIMDGNRAFFHDNEQFTRLCLVRGEEQGQFQWRIVHPSLKTSYSDSADFRNFYGPVLQEDWKTKSTAFKTASKTTGKLLNSDFLETTEVKGKVKSVYSILIKIKSTKFWQSAGGNEIGGLTLELKTTMSRGHAQKHKAKLCNIIRRNSTILLRGKLFLQEDDVPSNDAVTLNAKPIKTEYRNIMHLLQKWAKFPQEFPFLSVFLDNTVPLPMSRRLQRIQRSNDMRQSEIVRLIKRLNTKQREAVDNAIRNPVSIIQGPPGTGKTFTAATLAGLLLLKERGIILCTAPSHYAVDNIAQSVVRNSLRRGKPVKVLRIYADHLEKSMRERSKPCDLGPHVDALHEQVYEHSTWISHLNDDAMSNIRMHLENNRTDLLTTMEQKTIRNLKTLVEREIMDGYEVIVATTGCLSDNRIESWNGQSRKISTVIIDEAGQLIQPRCLHGFGFRQFRTVILGDHQQLRPQCDSMSSKLAGLGFCAMYWFLIGNTSIPHTMLEVQHRMSPDIRSIVSHLSYRGKLKDAEDILRRPNYGSDFLSSSLQLKSRLIVVNHHFDDQRVGKSYQNMQEAKLVVAMIEKLTAHGIASSDITTLTMYEAQKQVLEEKLMEKGVAVRNVDSFQGRENEVILLSLVRGGGGEIGFTKEINRLNVAISRAKEILVIFCNMATFQQHRSQVVTCFLKLLRNAEM